MHGVNLVKKNILDHKFPYWDIQHGTNFVDFQVEEITPTENWERFEQFLETAAPGRYKVTLGKNCNKENCRVTKGPQGFGTVTVEIQVANNIKAEHVDINSHNATYNKEIIRLQNELQELKFEQKLKDIEEKLKIQYLSKAGNNDKLNINELLKEHPEIKQAGLALVSVIIEFANSLKAAK